MNWSITKRNNEDFGIDTFRRDISRIFDDFLSFSPTNLFETNWIPAIDVQDDHKHVKIKAEMPGIDEKDLKVTIENNNLVISGEKKEERSEEDKDKRYIFSERKFGSFCRSIDLPEGIKTDKVNASFKKGVLKIEIPKDEAKKTKKINVQIQ